MSYMILFLLIASGYVFGAPILKESLQFRVVDCIAGDNDTIAKHIIEITNVNETCIRVNASTSESNEVYLYVVPETEIGVKIQIKTENCSVPLPDLHFSLCDDPVDINQTEVFVTFAYENATISLVKEDQEVEEEEKNSTLLSMFYTGPTVYETLHRLNDDDDDDDNDHTTIHSHRTTAESDDDDDDDDD
ncbi:hypothetical protein I4U23_027667 [Adineta vaga]|nr:hypothetical protein I4U23_027667 [Adineta vaga]